MKLLRNWKFAVVLTAIVALCALVLGVHRSVTKEADKVLTMFTQGVDDSGYGIEGDLEDRADYAATLCKVAAKYDGLSDEIDAVNKAVAELKTADGAGEKYDANDSLTGAVTALSLAMQSLPLSDADETYRSEYTANFESRGLVIVREAAEYNEQVSQYASGVLRSFPVTLLGGLAFLPEVEAFQ
ncbi:MAG: hypothetical protein VB055_08090 [Oscillospiraceae bacterium]|nr:hypothetical protein [Oscillospiraceae bacterium]